MDKILNKNSSRGSGFIRSTDRQTVFIIAGNRSIVFFKDVLKRGRVDMCLASLFAKWPGGLLSEISFC